MTGIPPEKPEGNKNTVTRPGDNSDTRNTTRITREVNNFASEKDPTNETTPPIVNELRDTGNETPETPPVANELRDAGNVNAITMISTVGTHCEKGWRGGGGVREMMVTLDGNSEGYINTRAFWEGRQGHITRCRPQEREGEARTEREREEGRRDEEEGEERREETQRNGCEIEDIREECEKGRLEAATNESKADRRIEGGSDSKRGGGEESRDAKQGKRVIEESEDRRGMKEEEERRRRRRRRGCGYGTIDLTKGNSSLWLAGLMFLVFVQLLGVGEGEALYMSHYPPPDDPLHPSHQHTPSSDAPTTPHTLHDADVKLPGRFFPKLPYLRPYLERPDDHHYNYHHRDDPTKPYYHRHHFPQQPHHHNTNHHQQQHHHHNHHRQPLLSPHNHKPHPDNHHNHQLRDSGQDYGYDNLPQKTNYDEYDDESMIEPLLLPSMQNPKNHNHHSHQHHKNTGDYPKNQQLSDGDRTKAEGGSSKEEEEEEGGYLFKVSEDLNGGQRQIIAIKGGRRKDLDSEIQKHTQPISQSPYQNSGHDTRDSESTYQHTGNQGSEVDYQTSRSHENPLTEDQETSLQAIQNQIYPVDPETPEGDLPMDAAAKVGPPPGPSFDRNLPRNITVQMGKTAVLSCRVFNVNDKSVSWIRQESLHILTVDKYKYSTDQRVSVIFNEPNLEWVLRIKGAQPDDAGQYECQVSTKPVLSYVVNLRVVETAPSTTALPPSTPAPAPPMNDEQHKAITALQVPRASVLNAPEIHVHRGSPINLTCVVTHGTERPVYIYWYHHDKVLDYEGRGGVRVETATGRDTVSHLLVEKAGPRDEGRYTCSPANGVKASINLHVLNGEYQAAMQTNGGRRKGGGTWPLLLLSSLLFLLSSSSSS